MNGVIRRASTASAGPLTAGGWTKSAAASPGQVSRGATVSISVTVRATARVNALVDVEVYDASGNRAAQRFWDAQSFRNGRTRNYQFSGPRRATRRPARTP